MRRSGLIGLLLLSLTAVPAMSERIMQFAAPTEEPDEQTLRPVGDPDVPPIDLDLFDSGTSREEAWPWPLLPSDN
ncbi:MAG: hypothetical protein WC829_04155 [Hyphomicrobium sp.]|jgi:hypothetical protein